MDSQITSKNDLYKAIGYVAGLLFLTIPLSFIGLRLLNLALADLPLQ